MKLVRFFQKILIFAGIGWISGCADYLDIVPDNVATMELAFSNRAATERYLFTCYWHLPDVTLLDENPGLMGGDEWWYDIDHVTYGTYQAVMLAQGKQNSNSPLLNDWDGWRNRTDYFVAIRNCNIFLENIHLPTDIKETERSQWIAEVKVLKAYYHFYLMQMYGPIPIVRENIPVSASVEEVRVFREPVDSVVNYIADLIDEAIPDLKLSIEDTRTVDAGRITKPIAASIKAKALVLGASPLFNGNSDYTNFKDKRGVQLISSDYDDTKWPRAAEAIKQAIDISKEAGHHFYQYLPTAAAESNSDITKLKCELREAITEKFNPEIIWPSLASTPGLQYNVIANLGTEPTTSYLMCSEFGLTLKIAEQYYTRNGLPIDEDAEWREWIGENFNQRYQPIESTIAAGSGIDKTTSLSDDHKYYIASRETTAKLHFYREPRFYAWIGFDRGIWEMNGIIDDTKSHVIKARAGERQGRMGIRGHSTCGYFAKKLVHVGTVKNANNSDFVYESYTYPLIRLADLYLLYAEALNESNAPLDEVYPWIDAIRKRAGLETVKDSWTKAIPSKQNKPYTKEGMREIIKRERMIELSMESWRLWDLLRWKDAMEYLNEPIRGWWQAGNSIETYYNVTTYWNQRVFNTRDYLWPLKLSTVQTNSNLVQNPGW
ncbi:MAG: RagB/SusD family nutrient uptake outer membrane protein [Candidatus Symbiothrix sp.]|jgi:hypothetical protein|nr:RagB/SusD family nutrient uptake outer membrane protein [Candidatus Symbiothrix sp.]